MSKSFSLRTKLTLLLLISGLRPGQAQDGAFPCANESGEYLTQLVGYWRVETRDRLSPGVYEENNGMSTIELAIKGCGIRESFKGDFRDHLYSREVTIMGLDSANYQMSVIDSEHGAVSIFQGQKTETRIEFLWYRDPTAKRLQSKYILTRETSNEFEFSSYLSMDYGKTWALTHERKYKRIR